MILATVHPATRKRKSTWGGKPARVKAATSLAAAHIGELEPGLHLTGISAGQYSLWNCLEAVLALTGPANLALSVWRMGILEAELLRDLKAAGTVRDLRLLIDRAYPRFKPHYARQIQGWFGAEAIRLTKTHLKVAVITNDRWQVVIRGSFNLNLTLGIENWDLDEGPELCAFFHETFDRLWRVAEPGFFVGSGEANRTMKRGWIDEVSETDRALLSDIFGEPLAAVEPQAGPHDNLSWLFEGGAE
jgi:hypothetical protein